MSLEKWVTLAIDLLKAYSWPITVVIALFLFREEIKILLGSIRRGKVGPVEIDIGPEDVVPSKLPEPVEKEETPESDSHIEFH
jgi:hypothetical protein